MAPRYEGKPQVTKKKPKGGGGSGTSGGGGGGPSQEDVDRANRIKQTSLLDVVVQAGGQILMEFFGINDILRCVQKGDIGACAMALIGALPWGKIFKAKKLIGTFWDAGKAVMKWVADNRWADAIRSRAGRSGSCPVPNSFVPGTAVLMADGGSKPIEDVDVGDEVVATDPETGRTETKTVTALITGEGEKNLVEVTVDTDGRHGDQTATVVATDGHPFWVPELGVWIDAIGLRAGQWLHTSAGTWVQITAIDRRTQPARVHNLTIADIHTYYVLAGNTPVLVHNTGPCKAALKKFPDLSHLEGADPEDVLNAIPDHWNVSPMKKAPPGGGIRFTNPNAPGQSIIYETGWPGRPDPVHRGPYLRVNDGAGYADRIPLAGNPEIMLREMRSQGLIP